MLKEGNHVKIINFCLPLLQEIVHYTFLSQAYVVIIDGNGLKHFAHRAMLQLRFPVFRAMAKSDGFDHDMATVVLAGVSTDEAKLIIEVAYGNDRCIKE